PCTGAWPAPGRRPSPAGGTRSPCGAAAPRPRPCGSGGAPPGRSPARRRPWRPRRPSARRRRRRRAPGPVPCSWLLLPWSETLEDERDDELRRLLRAEAVVGGEAAQGHLPDERGHAEGDEARRRLDDLAELLTGLDGHLDVADEPLVEAVQVAVELVAEDERV